jgi:hypothetical protein
MEVGRIVINFTLLLGSALYFCRSAMMRRTSGAQRSISD